MLIGNYHYSLQAKGRLAIPTAFRKSLGDKAIITQGIEKCLQILPFNTWSSMTQSLGKHPLQSQTSRQLRRLIAHNASQIEFDTQGRILIPKPQRDWANLSKKIVIAGSIDWVEIWDRENYLSYQNQLSTQAEELATLLEKQTNYE